MGWYLTATSWGNYGNTNQVTCPLTLSLTQENLGAFCEADNMLISTDTG